MITTVDEHLFDSSSTRRVWQHHLPKGGRRALQEPGETGANPVGRTRGGLSRVMNISTELAEMSSYGGFFALTVGGDASGWHPVGQFYADGCLDSIDATLERYRTTESRIGASLVHLGHAARLWSPVLACVLSHGVLPDLTDLQRADDGARLRLPEPIGEPVDNRSRPACVPNWRLPCCPATLRPRSSERPRRCFRCGPTCATGLSG